MWSLIPNSEAGSSSNFQLPSLFQGLFIPLKLQWWPSDLHRSYNLPPPRGLGLHGEFVPPKLPQVLHSLCCDLLRVASVAFKSWPRCRGNSGKVSVSAHFFGELVWLMLGWFKDFQNFPIKSLDFIKCLRFFSLLQRGGLCKDSSPTWTTKWKTTGQTYVWSSCSCFAKRAMESKP